MEKTSFNIIKGEAFTEDNPAYVSIVNQEDDNVEPILTEIKNYQKSINDFLDEMSESLSKNQYNSVLGTLNKIDSVQKTIKTNTDYLEKLVDIESKLTTLNDIQNLIKTNTNFLERLESIDGKLTSPLSTQLTGRKAALQWGDYNTVLNVAANAAQSITITPPVGELWRLKSLYVSIPSPSGATAGTHRLAVALGSVNSGKNTVVDARSNYADLIRLRNSVIDIATFSKAPSTEAAYISLIQETVVTNQTPLVLYYANETTGGNQTGTASVAIVREVEYVG